MTVADTLSSLPVFPFLASSSWSSIALVSIGAIAASVVGLYLYMWPYREYTLAYRNLRGPTPEHWFFGDLNAIIKAGPLELHAAWIKKFGPTFRYRVIFGIQRFFTADPVALSYVLAHADIFPKPEHARRGMADMLGKGVLVAEGADHRRQRKVLNPSFSPAAVRDMVPIFYDKAYELKNKLIAMIEDDTIECSPTPAKKEDKVVGGKKIDVMLYLGQATLDVIGIAGFNYDLQALSDPNNELARAYRDMMSAGQTISVMGLLQEIIPGFNLIPTKRLRTIKTSRTITQRIGKRLVEEKKLAIASSNGGRVEKGSDLSKDLLSILIKANMGSDLKPDQRMSDEEVMAQITTFMLAGNETSSTALTWILYTLTQYPESQERLRQEVMAVEDERPSMDALSALPYLDAVVHEVLRLCAPVTSTMRTVTEDVMIPLGSPIVGRDGQMMDSVHLKKGSTLFIPILSVNTSETIWGPDAGEYNPDRYLSLPPDTKTVPGTWGNLLTFLGGARNCIGYRFALAEIKAILFVLIRSLQFEELPSKPAIEKRSSIVVRSRVVGEEKAGLQMPLMVKTIA